MSELRDAIHSYDYKRICKILDDIPQDSINDVLTQSGQTPLMLAAVYCTSKSIRGILDKAPQHLKEAVLTAKNKWGKTPLMHAAAAGREQSVRTILDNTPQHLKEAVLTAKNKWGDTPLLHAMHNFTDHNVIKTILDKTPQDLKKIVLTAKNTYGQTPLMLAAKNKDYDSFTTILNNTPADLRNDMLTDTDMNENIILMLAARNKHDGSKLVETILDTLPDKKEKAFLAKNNNRDTPLMIAATLYNHKFITTLLEKMPEDVKKSALNEKDSQGRTPLMLGVGRYSDLKRGASYDPPELIENVANTARAIINGTPQDFLPTVLNQKDDQGRTPVMLALGDFNDAEREFFNRYYEEPSQKIEYIARTVRAIFDGMPPEIKVAVLNEKDSKGRTPLVLALEKYSDYFHNAQKTEYVEKIVSPILDGIPQDMKDAVLNQKDGRGRTVRDLLEPDSVVPNPSLIIIAGLLC